MSTNIEIKARFNDLTAARRKVEQLRARFVGTDHQIDTFFKTPNGRLKLRESSLNGNFLIPYLRSDKQKAKQSAYVLLPVEDVKATKTLLSQMFGIRLIVEKTRELFLFDNVRIHLDRVKNLGNFLEFEAVVDARHSSEQCRRSIDYLTDYFEISERDLVAGAYADLLMAKAINKIRQDMQHV
ncbi:MAG: class IV adenylate cyclase [Calditrichaeota bacterium]|nr:class IV adenylate cyclase [Calditrichota bacterium]